MGINRLSIGVQTFQDHLLKRIGRIHTAKEATTAIQLAKKIGFKNILTILKSKKIISSSVAETISDFTSGNIEKEEDE